MIDWAAVADAKPDDALEIWRELDVRGANLADTLARIEGAGAVAAEAMAAAVLGDALGEEPCLAMTEEIDAYAPEAYVPELAPEDDFDHPCLRRALQLWAIRVLPAARLEGDLRETMVLIAGLAPDDELLGAAYARVADEALLLEMLARTVAEGETELVDEVALRLSAAGRSTAAVALGIDGALLAFDPEVSVDVYLAALAADQLREATQLVAIERLVVVAGAAGRKSPERAQIVAGLTAVQGHGCVVDAAAIRAVDALTGVGFPADLPPTTSREAYRLLICRAVTSGLDATALWRKLIPPTGVVIDTYDEHRTDPDGNGDAYTNVATVRVAKHGTFVLPHTDLLPAMLLDCGADLDCYGSDPRGSVTVTFELAAAPHDRLRLTAIHWRFTEEVGD